MLTPRLPRSATFAGLACFAILVLFYQIHGHWKPDGNRKTGLSNVQEKLQPPSAGLRPAQKSPPGQVKPAGEPYSRTLVISRLKSEDVSWIDKEFPYLNKSIYVVDEEPERLQIPKNKGHEAMVYLTYIIDNYDNLPDTVLFFHPHQVTWHNNILLDLNSATTIQRLSDARVARQGYMNARCHHDPGCPDWLHLDRPKEEWDLVHKHEEQFFTSDVWRELHPDAPLPDAISQPCCAQFAVSGARIRETPLSQYHHYRNWLLNTPLTDENSGRIMEYTWQYIFTGKSEFCPPQHQCYCDGYGICFGSQTDAGLQHWLNVLRERELLDEKINEYKKSAGDNSEELAAALTHHDKLMSTLEKLKSEAYKRGEDPRNRAWECGRPWHEGDGF